MTFLQSIFLGLLQGATEFCLCNSIELMKFVKRIYRYLHSFFNCKLKVIRCFGTAVEEKFFRVHTCIEREPEFPRREDIRPCTDPGECPHHGKIAVGFCRKEYLNLRVPGKEGSFVVLVLFNDSIFACHIKRCSIHLCESDTVLFIDVQVTVFYGKVVGEFHKSCLRIRSSASFIRATGRVRANLTYPSPNAPKPMPGVATIPASFSSRAENAIQSCTGSQT